MPPIGYEGSHLHRYAQRQGVRFSALWFGFGNIPFNISSDKYTAVLNEASSIYFINLVVMYVLHSRAVCPSTSF
jgi:sodium/potassium-transporting ATPase subunit alpha